MKPAKDKDTNSARVMRQARDHLGSQQRLAELLDVTPDMLERWLTGHEVPPREAFLRALALWATEEYAEEQKLAESLVVQKEAELRSPRG